MQLSTSITPALFGIAVFRNYILAIVDVQLGFSSEESFGCGAAMFWERKPVQDRIFAFDEWPTRPEGRASRRFTFDPKQRKAFDIEPGSSFNQRILMRSGADMNDVALLTVQQPHSLHLHRIVR